MTTTRKVIPERLWFGNAFDARDLSRLHEHGVVAVVDVAYEESPASLSRDLMYCRIPMIDGDRNSESFVYAAVNTTVFLIRNELPTLVACSAGMSRSPSVVAAALAIVNSESPDASLERVVEGHPHDVSPKLWADVTHAYKQIVANLGDARP